MAEPSGQGETVLGQADVIGLSAPMPQRLGRSEDSCGSVPRPTALNAVHAAMCQESVSLAAMHPDPDTF